MNNTPTDPMNNVTPLQEGAPQPIQDDAPTTKSTPTPAAPELPVSEDVKLAEARAALADAANKKPDPAATPPTSTTPAQPIEATPSDNPSEVPTTQPTPLTPTPKPQAKHGKISWQLYAGGAGILLTLGGTLFYIMYWPAVLTVQATPDTAAISLGETSATGKLVAKIHPGTYQVSAQISGYQSFNTPITLKVHERKQLTVTLKEIPYATLLSNQRIQHMSLTASGDKPTLVYLEPQTGTAYRLFVKNPAKPVMERITPDNALKDVNDIRWSPNRQLAFIIQNNRVKLYDFKRYDLINQTVTDWPEGIRSIDWRPDGEKVAYVFHGSDGERTLIRAGKDNGEQEKIFNFKDTGLDDPIIRWSPDGKLISVLEKNTLRTLDVFTGKLSEPLQTGVADATWLPTSDRLLVTDANHTLNIVPTSGSVIPLNRTGETNEVTFFKDGQTMIQAKQTDSGVNLERVDLKSGQATPYALGTGLSLQPKHLTLSENEQTLYFISAGQPYTLKLEDGSYSSS